VLSPETGFRFRNALVQVKTPDRGRNGPATHIAAVMSSKGIYETNPACLWI